MLNLFVCSIRSMHLLWWSLGVASAGGGSMVAFDRCSSILEYDVVLGVVC
jgi:hypothetical protein